MSDTVTVLLAAFGGGLAGAVLQPVVSYVLQRVHSGEELRKRRERSLRRMLDSVMEHGRYCATRAMRALDPRTTDDWKEIEERLKGVPEFVWQPERIEDQCLRELAEKYDISFQELTRSLSAGLDPDAIPRLAMDLFKLQKQITARMDELNWPEADD